MRWWLAFAILLAPGAGAQMAEVLDPAGDVAYETQAGAQDSGPVQDNIDIVRAWIGNETLHTFDVGLEVVAQHSTLDANGEFNGIEHRAVEFSADGIRYQVRFDSGCDVGAASLEVQISETGWGSIDCVPEVNTGKSFTATVPKVLVLGQAGLPVRAGSVLDQWNAVAYDRVPPWTAVDRAPDAGSGDSFVLQQGGAGFGPYFFRSSAPFRSSNGGPDTFVFPILVETTGSEGTILIHPERIPAGWELRAPARVIVPAGSAVEFPVVVSTTGFHEHGTTLSFDLVLEPAEGEGQGRLELGIAYVTVPQLAGHHPDLYVHASEQDGVRGWMNTLQDDERGTATRLPARGGGFNTSQSNVDWFVPLDPSLLIGMDFDVNASGLLQTRIASVLPGQDARLLAQLVHCDPTVTEGGVGVPATCARGGDWFLLAQGESTPQPLSANSNHEFEVELRPTPYADFVPYVTHSNIGLLLELSWTGPPGPPAARDEMRVLELDASATTLHLPLHEYKDPIDGIFEDIGSLRLTPLGAYQHVVNAGQSAYFPFRLGNGAARELDIRLDAVGQGRDQLTITPDRFRLGVADERDIVATVHVPDDARPGDVIELILSAEDAKDPTVVALSKLRVVVTDEPQAEQTPPDIDDARPKATPSPPAGAVLLLLFATLAWGRRRD